MDSRFCRDPRLPNAMKSNCAEVQQHRFADRNLISGPGRFLVRRSRAVCPGARRPFHPTAGGPDANAFPCRLSEREFRCYPTPAANVRPPVGSRERVRWAGPALPGSHSTWPPAPGMDKYRWMRRRRAPTKQSGKGSEWHGKSCAKLIGHRKTRNTPSVAVIGAWAPTNVD